VPFWLVIMKKNNYKTQVVMIATVVILNLVMFCYVLHIMIKGMIDCLQNESAELTNA